MTHTLPVTLDFSAAIPVVKAFCASIICQSAARVNSFVAVGEVGPHALRIKGR